MRPPALAVLGLLLLLLPTGEATKKPTPCKRCRELVDKFNQGMVDTAKKNFGGGNTAWEEKTLSKYEFSEVRLLEIVEGLCEASDFECNQLLEEQEELLEAWWLRLKKNHPDLFEWFCVQTLKVCCPPGTYGPDCLACQGGSERPCSGSGHCSGDGTREGDGSCQCHLGYQGPLCTDCMDGYFRAPTGGTHSICSACDEACKTCVGPTNRDCDQCEVGWVRQDDACVDVDECAAEPPPCEDTQYCENINGSFVCEECDPTCVGCTGKGPAQCRECITGYSQESGQCEDIDECSLAEKPCPRDNENCYNTPGSFVCVCPDGFEEAEGTCVQSRPAGAGGTSELQCWGLPPPKPVGSMLPASPGSGGHSWRSWARSRVPPASASVISWPSPWSLRPRFPLLVGTPLVGSGPPPVTSIAGRDAVSKQEATEASPTQPPSREDL